MIPVGPVRPAVEIVEVGPRDGLQNEDVEVPTDIKVELVRRAVAAGLRRIEAVSFVHPGRVPQMADAEQVMAAVPRPPGVVYSGLVLNERGLDRALAAGVDEVNYVVVATDTFSRRNQGAPVEEVLQRWERIAARSHAAGVRPLATVAVAFGCPFEGEVSADRVAALVDRIAASGPAEIALADTVGVGVPSQVTERVGRLAQDHPEVATRCHFHNTRNTGYANAVAAVHAGVGALDASIGGLGGCPFAPAATGNIATEDLVYLLSGLGVLQGIDQELLAAAGSWTSSWRGAEAPALLGRAGTFPAVSPVR